MAIAVDPNKIVPYVLKEDRHLPPDQQTIWKTKILTARQHAHLQDYAVQANSTDSSMFVKSGSTVLETIKMGLYGWENFKDENGKEVEWRIKDGIPLDENFDRMQPRWRQEISKFISERNTLSAEQIKNSGSGQESVK